MKSAQLCTAVRILDVRTPGEFEDRQIAGAYNVPLDQLAEHAPEFRAATGGVLSARLPYHRGSSCDTEAIVRRFVAADRAAFQ